MKGVLFVLLAGAVLLVSCRQGEFERKLNRRMVEHLQAIVTLRKSVVELETKIHELDESLLVKLPDRRSAFEEWNLSELPQTPISKLTDLIVMVSQWEAGHQWMDELSNVDAEKMMEELEAGAGVEIGPLTCTRVSAGDLNFEARGRNRDSMRFKIPSRWGDSDLKRRDDQPEAFGRILSSLILMRGVENQTFGDDRSFAVAWNENLKRATVKLDGSNVTRQPQVRVTIHHEYDRESEARFAMVEAPSVTREHTILTSVEPDKWQLMAVDAHDADRVSILFLKIIPLK